MAFGSKNHIALGGHMLTVSRNRVTIWEQYPHILLDTHEDMSLDLGPTQAIQDHLLSTSIGQ